MTTPRPGGSWMMSTSWMILLTLIPILASAQSAPGSTVDEKLDTLLVKQQQLVKGQESLIQELLPLDPFPTGAFAVALNLPLLVAASAADASILSASLSWFPPHSPWEFTLPIWYRNQHDHDFSGTLVDTQARLYLNPRRSGLYWVGGLRSAWLTGRHEGHIVGYDDGWMPIFEDTGLQHLHKLGAYGGVGWRAKSSRFYWNMNLVLGRYMGDTDKTLDQEGMLGGKLLLDAEFFKFGIIF